jgi:hypothetical protein
MDSIIRPFERMGARATVIQRTQGLRLDIVRDRRGPRYHIEKGPQIELCILDVRPRQRHLLLLGREQRQLGPVVKHKFLCGHDEREWFVAGIPEGRGISDVPTAMEALKPPQVRMEQERRRIRQRDRASRRTSAYVRQGEWFFIPVPHIQPPRIAVLRHEPLRRGMGKPHWAELLFRSGGETVYISQRHPLGITEAQRHALFRNRPEARRWDWQVMRRNPEVYVMGRISHPDHATITLSCWHMVQMNTEHGAPSIQHVAFLD